MLEGWKRREQRADFRSAQICAIFATAFRDTKEHPKPFTPEDFMPKYDADPEKPVIREKQTPEQMFELVKMLNAAFGGEVH